MACGFSQDDVAAALCIHRATYTNYESGKTCPTMVTLMELSRIFQIPPESFLHPEEFLTLSTTRQRTYHMPAVDVKRVGDLSKEEKQLIEDHRLKESVPARPYDSISQDVDKTLSLFAVKKSYMGYLFLVEAIREAVISLPERLTTTEICELVASNEEIASQVVSRELTRIVNKIWNQNGNPQVFSSMTGIEAPAKPLPVEFINTIADYLDRQS